MGLAAMVVSRSWVDDVPLLVTAVAVLLYVVGGRRRLHLVSGARRPGQGRRDLAFAIGLLGVVAALQPPLDGYADRLLWAHMVQHLLLITVSAPLLVLAAPWTRLWRGLPLRLRRGLARPVAKSPWAAPLRRGSRVAVAPVPVWILFNADLVGWHLPWLYDLALRHQAVHDLEHLTFLVLSILFWAQVADSPPLRARLDYVRRLAYVVSAAVVGWLIALVLAFATTPLYPYYAALARRPGGISALSDQQVAAGMMWVPGSFAYSLAVFLLIYRWLDEGRGGKQAGRPTSSTRRLAGEHL